ncbi:hypothetical protein IU459_16260 [Nocardia amamiensis]|uniref:Secreted protein n=1 Tax=Nocardia amamiensis TaxID=404578 RepID=A0ABS0CW59_9NOCA|nr:hypothetical protein [Nocardia amamiensis]MBF6299084.1 hypothetical protein [Nocardia amamiensis]
MMSPLLVAIPWAGSVIFTGALCFRLGYWWKTTELQGRHAVGNVAMADDPRADDETLDSGPEKDQPSPSARPPARPVRWWSEEDDTDEPPWVKDPDWHEGV